MLLVGGIDGSAIDRCDDADVTEWQNAGGAFTHPRIDSCKPKDNQRDLTTEVESTMGMKQLNGTTWQQKFPLGQIVATPGALAAMQKSGDSAHDLIMRHSAGDWGDVCDEDKKLNDAALHNGERLLSAYTLRNGVKIWIISEADRSVTTFLLPDEY